MTLSRQALEDAIGRFETLATAEPALAQELGASIAEFFPHGAATPDELGDPDGPLAARRHLEWFLFERPSEVLGGVPVEALMTQNPEAAEHAEALLNSLAGVFEVTSVEEDRGLWLRDVFGLGEYPVDEPEATHSVRPGDVAVGRVFPAGDSVFRLSPAATVLRNAELLTALKADVERLRAGRRGSLRIAQVELERMFFGAQAAAAPPPIDPVAAEREARESLTQGGADAAFVARLFDELRAASRAGRGDAITEALNQLAFETAVDLEHAREHLVTLWSAWSAPNSQAKPTGESDAAAPPDAVADALARFDEGRGEGRDLDALFRSLEEDLGLEQSSELDQEIAPDFPGVVGAVVQEFLWETGVEHGEETAKRFAGLRHLADFGAGIGVFENLSSRDLLEFAGRYVLDSELLKTADEAIALLAALEAFCRWCEDAHSHELWTAFEATHERLLSSVPRLVELRRRAPAAAVGEGAVYTFERASDGGALLVDRAGAAHDVDLTEVHAGLLRPGDLVQADLDGRTATIGACYPAEILELVG